MEAFDLKNEPLTQLAVVWMAGVGLYFFKNGKGFLWFPVFKITHGQIIFGIVFKKVGFRIRVLLNQPVKCPDRFFRLITLKKRNAR